MHVWIVIGLLLSLISKVWAGEEYPQVEPSGYMQAYVFYKDQGDGGNDTGTVLNSIHVGFSGKINEKVEFGIELDATTDVVLDEAKIELSYLDNLVFILGQFNVPFGVELPYDSTELLTINRAEYWDIFDEYRTGMALAGQNDNDTFNYELAAFIRPKDNPNGDAPEEDYVGRVQLNTLAGVILGSSVYYDRSEDVTNSLDLTQTRFGVDARIYRSNLALWFEFMTGTDNNRPTNGSAKTQTDYIGYYGMVGYTIKPDWQIVAKYDVYDPDTHQGNDSFWRYTAGINWEVDELIRLQANLEYSHSEPAVDPDVTSIFQFQLVY